MAARCSCPIPDENYNRKTPGERLSSRNPRCLSNNNRVKGGTLLVRGEASLSRAESRKCGKYIGTRVYKSGNSIAVSVRSDMIFNRFARETRFREEFGKPSRSNSNLKAPLVRHYGKLIITTVYVQVRLG